MAHGLMFHHFENDTHPKGQGSLSSDQFAEMLHWIGIERFLSPQEWIYRANRNELQNEDLCICFDDGLRCQYDVALPVLQKFGLQAFWFVYSSVLNGTVERLELYRYYRTVAFDDIDDFYHRFFQTVDISEFSHSYREKIAGFDVARYLAAFSFYTDNDRKFRFTRDRVLGQGAYFQIMDDMIAQDASFSDTRAADLLWMKSSQLVALHQAGHEIGLHSYSHPTDMASLTAEEQLWEYRRNSEDLSAILGVRPRCASYPCGSQNEDTHEIMRVLGVEIAFRADMNSGVHDLLNLPREDHSHVAIKMGLR